MAKVDRVLVPSFLILKNKIFANYQVSARLHSRFCRNDSNGREVTQSRWDADERVRMPVFRLWGWQDADFKRNCF